jgi:hypothetical protein
MKFSVLFVLIFVMLFLFRDSEAYIDPGSGSYVLQLVVASFFAIVFALKMFWRNIRAFFSRGAGKQEQTPGSEQS